VLAPAPATLSDTPPAGRVQRPFPASVLHVILWSRLPSADSKEQAEQPAALSRPATRATGHVTCALACRDKNPPSSRSFQPPSTKIYAPVMAPRRALALLLALLAAARLGACQSLMSPGLTEEQVQKRGITTGGAVVLCKWGCCLCCRLVLQRGGGGSSGRWFTLGLAQALLRCVLF